MQEVKISLQIGEITHEIGEKNNTAGSCTYIIMYTYWPAPVLHEEAADHP